MKFPGWQLFKVEWPPTSYLVPSSRVAELRDGIAPGQRLLYWARTEDSASSYAAAAAKRALLITEQKRLARPLQDTPLIRSLLEAEISRLEPFAIQYEEQKGSDLVTIIRATRQKR